MDVKDENFEEKVIEKSKEMPVIVDFWASWCVPCNILAPVLEKIAEEYKGKLILAKVNVDECPQTSDKFGINAIPAIKLFKKGEVVAEFEGVKSEETIKELLDSNI